MKSASSQILQGSGSVPGPIGKPGKWPTMATCRPKPKPTGQAICWGGKEICMVYKCAWLCAKEPGLPAAKKTSNDKLALMALHQSYSYGLPWHFIKLLPALATLALQCAMLANVISFHAAISLALHQKVCFHFAWASFSMCSCSQTLHTTARP